MLIGTIRCSITSFQKDIGHDVGRIIDRCDIDKETLISNEKCPAANKRQRLAGRQGSQPEIRRVDIGRKEALLAGGIARLEQERAACLTNTGHVAGATLTVTLLHIFRNSVSNACTIDHDPRCEPLRFRLDEQSRKLPYIPVVVREDDGELQEHGQDREECNSARQNGSERRAGSAQSRTSRII
jgi:hypothetical protein